MSRALPKAVGLALVLAALVPLTTGQAGAAPPILWTLDTADRAVEYATENGAQCVPVGPRRLSAGTALYAEFACAVTYPDGTQEPLAIEPASLTKLVYRRISSAGERPARLRAVGPSRADFVERVIIVSRGNDGIELQDQSVWQVTDPGHLLEGWRQGDRVTIQPGHLYEVVDLTRHQSLSGSFRGFDW